MGFLRKLFRLLKYRIKFLNKNDNAKINYFVQSRFLDTNLTNLMDHYGSDKGGLKKNHNFSDYYQTIFFDKKENIKNMKTDYKMRKAKLTESKSSYSKEEFKTLNDNLKVLLKIVTKNLI
jgi:aspartyl-tRNA synthetase